MSYEIPINTATLTGAVAIKPKTDSTSAILFQTSGGTDVFRLDTTNKYNSIGIPGTPNCSLTVTRNSTSVTPVVPNSIHLVGADAANVRIQLDAFGTAVGAGVTGRTATGTAASPTAVANGTSIFLLQGRGYLGSSYGNTAQIAFNSEELYTNSTAKTGIAFSTTPSGATTAVEVMRLDGAGHLGLGTSTPATSAILELSSTTGALLISRMTSTQRDALTAVNGMIIYNTTTAKFQAYEAGAWTNII